LGIRDKLQQVIAIKDSPKKIALSFAIGVFLGMSPLLGLHTVLGIVFAWLFRLNKFVTIVGVYVTNPWTIIPIYTFATWVGARILGIDHLIPDVDWNAVTLTMLMNEMKAILVPFVFGTTLLGVLSALLGYVVVFHAIVKQRGKAVPEEKVIE
jgi:uncharacterized protein (DUF2062 family)